MNEVIYNIPKEYIISISAESVEKTEVVFFDTDYNESRISGILVDKGNYIEVTQA